MMKSYFLSVLMAGLIALSFSACQNDVDVMEGCDKITTNSILGEHSFSYAEGLNYTVVEYKLAEDGKGVFVERTFGDAIKTAEKTYGFTYSLEAYGEHNVGRFIRINSEEAGESELLWLDGAIRDDQKRVYEAVALEENFTKVITDFPNTNWNFSETVLWIDTIPMDSLHYYKKNVRDTVFNPETGKPFVNSAGKDSFVIVSKEFVDTVRYEVYDTVGNKSTLDIKFVVKKDTKNSNIGSYIFDYKEYDHDLTLTKDSVIDKTFHWGFSSVTSAKKFIVAAVDDAKKDTMAFEISKFDKKKKVLTLEERELKLQ